MLIGCSCVYFIMFLVTYTYAHTHTHTHTPYHKTFIYIYIYPHKESEILWEKYNKFYLYASGFRKVPQYQCTPNILPGFPAQSLSTIPETSAVSWSLKSIAQIKDGHSQD